MQNTLIAIAAAIVLVAVLVYVFWYVTRRLWLSVLQNALLFSVGTWLVLILFGVLTGWMLDAWEVGPIFAVIGLPLCLIACIAEWINGRRMIRMIIAQVDVVREAYQKGYFAIGENEQEVLNTLLRMHPRVKELRDGGYYKYLKE